MMSLFSIYREREIINFSKGKTNTQPLGTVMKVLSPRQRSSFPSEIKKFFKLPSEEDTAAKFDLGNIINATVLIRTSLNP